MFARLVKLRITANSGFDLKVSAALFLGVALSIACGAPPMPPLTHGEVLSGTPSSIPSSAMPPAQVLGEAATPSPLPTRTATAAPIATVGPTPTIDRVAYEAELAKRFPRVMTLEKAREVVPFHIQVAEYVPEGYELGEQVRLMEGPDVGSEVKGVHIMYTPKDLVLPYSNVVFVDQRLGKKGTPTVVGATRSPTEDVGGLEADVWEGENMLGKDFTFLYWEDPGRGVVFDVVSTFEKEETLRIVRSFR